MVQPVRLVGSQARCELAGVAGGVSRLLAGRCGGLADGNVVGVPLPAVRPETDHHLGPELADKLYHLAYQEMKVGLSEGAVEIVPAPQVRSAQPLACQAQLGLADRRDRAPGG